MGNEKLVLQRGVPALWALQIGETKDAYSQLRGASPIAEQEKALE